MKKVLGKIYYKKIIIKKITDPVHTHTPTTVAQ